MKHLAKFLALGSLIAIGSPFAKADPLTSTVTFQCPTASCTPALPQSFYGYTGSTSGNGGSAGTQTSYLYTFTNITAPGAPTASNWMYQSADGDPSPDLQATVVDKNTFPASTPDTFQITDGGLPFLLDSFDIAANNTQTIYYVVNYITAAGLGPAYTGSITGNQTPCPPNTQGSGSNCYTLVVPTPEYATAVDIGVYSLSNTANASKVNIDDITITATPEPSSLLLLGTGLASACGVLYRKRRNIV